MLKKIIAGAFILIILTSAQFRIMADDENRSQVPFPATGSICVGRAERPTQGEKSLANPTGENKIFNYSVQINQEPKIQVKHHRDVIIKGIALGRKHRIVIRGNGKPFASFWFKFENYSSPVLCLWFKPLYETWSLWGEKESRHLCRCK